MSLTKTPQLDSERGSTKHKLKPISPAYDKCIGNGKSYYDFL